MTLLGCYECGRWDARRSNCTICSSSLHKLHDFTQNVFEELVPDLFGDAEDVLKFHKDNVLVLCRQALPDALELSDERSGALVVERLVFEELAVSFEDVLDVFGLHLVDVFPQDQCGLLRINVCLDEVRKALKVRIVRQFKQIRTQTNRARVVIVT